MASMLPDVLSGSPELSKGERTVSVIVGLMIAAAGAKPRPNVLLNLAALAAGSYLAHRGATGYCPIIAALTGARGAQESPARTSRADEPSVPTTQPMIIAKVLRETIAADPSRSATILINFSETAASPAS